MITISKAEMDFIKSEGIKRMNLKQLYLAKSLYNELFQSTRQHKYKACILYVNERINIKTKQNSNKKAM